MGLELRVIISANINSTIAVILSPNLSLYDLQKPRYIYGIIAATPQKRAWPSPHHTTLKNYGST